MSDFVYFNGMLKHQEELSPWILDRSYLYGEGLFETMKATQGYIPFLPKHLNRLFCGMDLLRMRLDLSASKLEFAIYRTLHHNRLKEAYLRLTVSRQNLEFGSFQSSEEANVLILSRPLHPLPHQLYTAGMSARVMEDFKISPDLLCQIKSTNYLRHLLAHRMAQEYGEDEALFLNIHGNLTEGATTNLFIFDGKKILTPPLSEGVLPGVTRRVVLDLLTQNYMEHEEKPIALPELLSAKEAFLTNSIKEIVPLTRVNGQAIGQGQPGLQTKKIRQLFQEEIQYRLESFESKRWGVK